MFREIINAIGLLMMSGTKNDKLCEKGDRFVGAAVRLWSEAAFVKGGFRQGVTD
ncbi:hypothetical protein [Pseudomonas sp. PDM11]|uniref:hypothetical protein n=1 Tax=Pseudomonas sp. PDM11 TaxID=2769309 RepID=UPI00177C6B4F|nr:hypothetical protein [Pseudomonas sp. PDM11]MBD9397959.1 hypothetical protein [Pseudomonas sp. PDM11]